MPRLCWFDPPPQKKTQESETNTKVFNKTAARQVVNQVLQHYGDKLFYTLHIYPLWLHRQAWIVAEVTSSCFALRPNSLFEAITWNN